MDVFSLVVLVLVLGLIVWLINQAPFIDARFKQIATWVILVFFVLWVVQAMFGPFPHLCLGRRC